MPLYWDKRSERNSDCSHHVCKRTGWLGGHECITRRSDVALFATGSSLSPYTFPWRACRAHRWRCYHIVKFLFSVHCTVFRKHPVTHWCTGGTILSGYLSGHCVRSLHYSYDSLTQLVTSFRDASLEKHTASKRELSGFPGGAYIRERGYPFQRSCCLCDAYILSLLA